MIPIGAQPAPRRPANLEKEVHRRTAELRESAELLTLAAESAEAGFWSLDYASGEFWATERTRRIFEFSANEIPTMELVEKKIHPEDRDLVLSTIAQAWQECRPAVFEHRVVLGDGSVRWISSRGSPHFKATGEPHRLMGVTVDKGRLEKTKYTPGVNSIRP
jgi:PAS domain S-box-containing protein